MQCRTAAEHIDRVLDFPSTPADQHQSRRALRVLTYNITPKIKQQQMVLARLNRAEANEIGPFRQGLLFRHDRWQFDAKARHDYWLSAARACDIGPNSFRCRF